MADFMKAVPEGGSAGPDELSDEALKRFTSQYSGFNEVVSALRESHSDLSRRYAALQEELECANRQLRQALSEKASAAAYLENILRSISSGVISVDLEGRIQHFNKAAERIFERAAADLLGRRYSEVLPPGAPTAEAALRGPRAVCDREKVCTDASGRTLHLAVSTSILTDAEGRVEGAVEIVNDLSRLRSLESEVLRVKTLAALGEMAATVAHEIRNPLGGIAGFAGLLARDFDPGDDRRTLAEKIIRGCENLNRIVTNLLQYAQPLKLERRQCDLKAELLEEVALFKQDLTRQRRAVVVRHQFSPEPLCGLADPLQLRLVLHNLLSNAADAVGRGEVVLGLERQTEDDGVARARLWVADNGPGVPEAHRERVFTPFFTTKDRGTGLGLATVRKIIDAHRGRIVLTPSPAGGACFDVHIPLG
jgi:PAS domain S-box-containing protein